MMIDSCIVVNHISAVLRFHDHAGAGPLTAAKSSARSRSFPLDVVPSARRDAAKWPTDALLRDPDGSFRSVSETRFESCLRNG